MNQCEAKGLWQGATWATMFPQTVRAAVLDGAVDPHATSAEEGMAQAKGFDGQLATFLAACSKNKACEFYNGGKSEAAFDSLILELNAKPLTVSADRTPAKYCARAGLDICHKTPRFLAHVSHTLLSRMFCLVATLTKTWCASKSCACRWKSHRRSN